MNDPVERIRQRIIGGSPWAHRMRAEIQQVAVTNSTVLITGPTGTGKELIARAIHAQSPRADRPFLTVDCASIVDGLFTSHMFGHRKGAFTGATHESVGCFRAADGGTIFLDEIGDLGSDLQAKLLRVLQERIVVPVGGHEGIPVDVRVIAATNRDLRRAVVERQFRDDLYYRLQVVTLKTTALRERPEDIGPLAQHLLEAFASRDKLPTYHLAPAALRCLESYHWPGNVRQLENLLARAVLFGHDNPLEEDVIAEMLSDQLPIVPEGPPETPVLPDHVVISAAPENCSSDHRWPTMAQLEREHLQRTLRHAGYNQSAAARLLGWDRNQLRRKMKKYGFSAPSTPTNSGAVDGEANEAERADEG